MKKREYRSKGEKFFIDYLPDDVFNSLSEKERHDYKLYRDNHRYIYEGNLKIKEWEKEIDKLKEKIKLKKLQINGFDVGENINPIDGEIDKERVEGWKEKMIRGYNRINHLSKDYQFNISVGVQIRKSKIYELYEGKDLDVMSNEKHKRQTKFKGKTLKPNERITLRITRTKDIFKNIHVGSLELVREGLSDMYGEDWSNETLDTIKSELRSIYSTYTRYHVFKSNWENFFSETHSFRGVMEWCKKMGDERYDW